MVTTQIKNTLVEEFNSNFKKNVESNLSDLDLVGFMKQGDVELVKKSVEKIRSNVFISIPEDFSVAKFITHITCTGSAGSDNIAGINIAVSNKINADKVFKFKATFGADNVVNNIANFFRDIYEALLIDSLAEENIVEINKVLDEAAADVDYGVSITSTIGNTGSKISFISDDEVVFIADLDRIFEVNNILALYEPDEDFSEEEITAAKKAIADEIAKAQTTEQLVQARGTAFIAYFANINKGTKGITLIKGVTGRKITSLPGAADGVGYYSEGDTFALVARRDGNYEVLLSPFDVNTYRKVDVDVLAKIGK